MSTTERLPEAVLAGLLAFCKTVVAVMEGNTTTPKAGTAESMRVILQGVKEINDIEDRGATIKDVRKLAQQAGMSPMGIAGYYTGVAKLLEIRSGPQAGRWITETGRERLESLS